MDNGIAEPCLSRRLPRLGCLRCWASPPPASIVAGNVTITALDDAGMLFVMLNAVLNGSVSDIVILDLLLLQIVSVHADRITIDDNISNKDWSISLSK